jgi:hypothetical protein
MMTLSRRAASIYVDRSSERWIVRDPDGDFWIVPIVDDPWEHRQPFDLTDDVELEPVPGHY